MAIDPRLMAMIERFAPRYGLDPRAVAAVSMNESGGRFGAVGDGGTSFGPWQLHVGGALPSGKTAAWANSAAGVQYALRQMAASGARGLRGQAAVSSIARNFERPADPGAEISTAMRYYQTPGFARGSAAAGAGGGGVVGGGGGAAGNPAAALAMIGAIKPINLNMPLRQTPSAMDTLQQFAAAHAPAALSQAPQVAFPSQLGESTSALSDQLGAIHDHLLRA